MNLFGTKFCIPKGYDYNSKNGKLQLKCSPIAKKEEGKIRDDIIMLYEEHDNRPPTEDEFRTWLNRKEGCRGIIDQIVKHDLIFKERTELKQKFPNDEKIELLLVESQKQRDILLELKREHNCG